MVFHIDRNFCWDWDIKLRECVLATPGSAQEKVPIVNCAEPPQEGREISGQHGVNLWDDEQWRQSLPRPDQSFSTLEHFAKLVPDLMLPPDQAQSVQQLLQKLFDVHACASDLKELYLAYERSQTAKQQVGS